MRGGTVSDEVIAVYVGWGTGPVDGATGGIVRAAAEGGTGRDSAEKNAVPGEVVAGYVGWVTGPVYGATGAERAKGGTVRGATEGDPARDPTEGSTVPGGVIAGYMGWVTGAVYGATRTVRVTGGTVRGATAGGRAVVATESVFGTVGAVHKPIRSRWRSTAAIAVAVTASTICFKEGAEAASEPCTVLDIGAREGRHCVTRGLNILGVNDGVSLSGSAAWNITGVLAVGLVQFFADAVRSRYPSQRRWTVSSSLGRWRVRHDGVDRL